jgi:hypothetical protein
VTYADARAFALALYQFFHQPDIRKLMGYHRKNAA